MLLVVSHWPTWQKLQFLCYFYVASCNGFENFGVCVDIAGRRLSIRATDTDTNEGVSGFYSFMVLFISFPINFVFLTECFGFLSQLVGCLFWAVKSEAPSTAPSKDGSSLNQLLGIKGAAQETVSLPKQFCNCNSLFTIWCRFVDWITALIESSKLIEFQPLDSLSRNLACVCLWLFMAAQKPYIYTQISDSYRISLYKENCNNFIII